MYSLRVKFWNQACRQFPKYLRVKKNIDIFFPFMPNKQFSGPVKDKQKGPWNMFYDEALKKSIRIIVGKRSIYSSVNNASS